MGAPKAKRGRPPAIAVPEHGPRILKRYGNRRLYDTRTSVYCGFGEVLRLIDTREDFTVIDAMTGADLTSATIRHALLTDDTAAAIPVDLLISLYRAREVA